MEKAALKIVKKPVAANVVKAVTTVTEFNRSLVKISEKSESLAQIMHVAGVYALRQVNVEGNADAAMRLIEAIGDKQDVRRIGQWFTKFGKLGVKNNKLVYKKRKDITPANVEGWLKKASDTPYWALVAQPKLEVTFDYLAMVKSIVDRANKKDELEEEGKKVTEKNVGVLAKLADILVSFSQVEAQPVAKKAAGKAKNKVNMAASAAATGGIGGGDMSAAAVH